MKKLLERTAAQTVTLKADGSTAVDGSEEKMIFFYTNETVVSETAVSFMWRME